MATPRFDLNGFINDIKNRGVLRTHTFLVDIPVPAYLKANYPDVSAMSIRCEQASLPGISLAEAQGPPRYGYGPTEFNPYGVMHDNITLSFILDRKSAQYAFFYDWMNVIVNYDNSRGLGGEKTYNNGGKFKTYEVGYKKSYSVDMTVTVYNEAHESVQVVKMYQAFPRGINAIDLNWQNTDQIAKLQIPFTFREYVLDFPQIKP